MWFRCSASARYLSVMIEAGSKVNWAALESGAVDKVFLYYAPKILGGWQSLPMAGGIGRMRRADAIVLERREAAHDSARRIRGRSLGRKGLRCSPESSKSWAKWSRGAVCKPGRDFPSRCAGVLSDLTLGAQYRGEWRLPHGGRHSG